MPQTIFVLTGAGVSAESGLGTFRDKRGEGIWAKFDPMKLATPEASRVILKRCSRSATCRRNRDAKPSSAFRARAA